MRRRVLGVAAISVALSSVLFIALGGVVLGARPPSFVLHGAIAWGSLVAVVAWLLLRRGGHGLGSPSALLALGAVASAPLLGVLYMCLCHAEDAGAPRPAPLHAHVMCFALAAVFAAAPLAVLVAARRGADPVHPRAFGALAGAVSGGVGGVILTVHCPIAVEAHVMLAHAGPCLVLAAVGAALGVRLFGVR